MQVAVSTVDEVAIGASGSRNENGVTIKNKEPGETMKADKVDLVAGRVTDEVQSQRLSQGHLRESRWRSQRGRRSNDEWLHCLQSI